MIVTSLPRSGSTKYCMDLADKLGYQYYDEIFDLYDTTSIKQQIHEIKLKESHPRTAAFLNTVDFNKSVVNSHDINFFALERTDVFLSRKNVQDSIWSYIAFSDKWMTKQTPPSSPYYGQLMIAIGALLVRRLNEVRFYYEYCVTNNKTIVVPDLEFTDTAVYRDKYPMFKQKVEALAHTLILPAGLVYE